MESPALQPDLERVFDVTLTLAGKLHPKTVGMLRRWTGNPTGARTVRTWAPILHESGASLSITASRGQDPRLVAVDAPRSELNVDVATVLAWVNESLLPTYRFMKKSKVPKVYRGRRFALTTDVVALSRAKAVSPRPRTVPAGRRGVYVIELAGCAKAKHLGLRCVYVGESSLAPRARFMQHAAGYKQSNTVKRLGRELRGDLYLELPLATTAEASRQLESDTADALRAAGWGVHGGH